MNFELLEVNGMETNITLSSSRISDIDRTSIVFYLTSIIYLLGLHNLRCSILLQLTFQICHRLNFFYSSFKNHFVILDVYKNAMLMSFVVVVKMLASIERYVV